MTTTDSAPFIAQVAAWAVTTPVEVRISRAGRDLVYVLLAHEDAGVVRYSLSVNGSGQAESLANLQASPKVVFPRKAVSGWQAEVVAWAATGLGSIVEVR
jgi:hypothetical protein